MKDDQNVGGANGRTELEDVVRARIEGLRARLIDSSRRNPLIQVPFRQNSSTLIRFVDELPDTLARRLAARSPMRLVALPAIDEPLPDEETDAFIDAVGEARLDEVHIKASLALDPTDPDYDQQELDLDRALKDRVRADLGLPERQTEEKPSLEAHARAHGILPDYILPEAGSPHDDGRHEDADIQTLLLPDRLDRVGRSLYDKGHAFERETGVNVLHTAFGILEWREPGSARGSARSPLLLLEIRMSKKKAPSGTEYTIVGENELSLNSTLALTLSSQFGLELPRYEGGCVEDYLREVADLAPPGWTWSVRREALAGVFPSSRIAMYRDLDPDEGPIARSDIVGTMLSRVGGDGASYAEVYDTDDPAIESRVPRLILDADASQFSSLADVANGQNVAIEGPPGSGKSQTIVNLTASAIAEGKKVLFVAEKLTALDVVRNRLEATGLGEFVLPLQAGRGSRDAVFQSLDDRLSMEGPPSGASDAHAARHRALVAKRSEMQAYLNVLGSPLGTTGMTVHAALGLAISSAHHLAELPRELRRLRLTAPERIDPDTQAEMSGDAAMVVDRLASADRIARLWRDASKAPIRIDEAEDLAAEIASLARAIEDARADDASDVLRRTLPSDPVRADEDVTITALEAISGHETGDADLIVALLDGEMRAAAVAGCEAHDRMTVAEGELSEILGDPDADDADEVVAEAVALATRLGGIIDPSALAAKIAAMIAELESSSHHAELASALPARWAQTAQQDGTTLADLRIDAEMLLRFPKDVLDRRQPDEAKTLPPIAREAAVMQRKLAAELASIRETLPQAGAHETRRIQDAASTIEGSGLFRGLSGTYKAAWSLYRDDLGGDPKAGRPGAIASLRAYARWADRRDAFSAEARFSSALGDAFAGYESDADLLDGIASFHGTTERVSRGDERLRYALEAGPLDAIRAFAVELDLPAMTTAHLDQSVAAIQEDLASAQADLQTASRLCLAFCRRDRVDLALAQTAKRVRHEMSKARSVLSSSRARPLLKASATNEVRTAIGVAQKLSRLPDPTGGVEFLRRGIVGEVLEEARTFFARLDAAASSAASIAGELGLDIGAADGDAQVLVALADRMDDLIAAASDPEGLVERARLLRAISALDARGFADLTAWIQRPEGRDRQDDLPGIVKAIFARSLTDHVEARFGRTLDMRDGADLDRLRDEIASIDRGLLGVARQAIREDLLARSAPPAGNGTGRVGTYTDMSLIRHEIGKSRNRIGVRDLTSRAGSALIELKPCWMMSPLAVAQYLGGDFKFDLVVIDEASQMTPENALGAIMRAHQVVVVGDTKQLPPTSFFSKMIGDDDEDRDARTDIESILDMANATFMPVRQLRWHYRSRHPDLIAISNRMVYDDKLTIFPAARDDDPDLGVELVEVDGEYLKGRNIPEARAIVSGAIQHMRNHPERSLGLATMNKDQTELIMQEFERERARNPHVEAFIDYWADREDGLEEFFVKNLETIQGDERDVIMISTLYGPDPTTGTVYQRFGPVNSAHGHRRLNVLFSRAKEKIVTYSSMKPADIKFEGKAFGVEMLRAWLEFSHTGRLTDAQGEARTTDSPFEDYVISQIEAAGFEAVPQVGASGYRIDIGVRHESWPYGFILAVECDGAPYHSSRSSRDRDRLRQQVLEGLGWHFHRIWSTDWFQDPRREIERLRSALKDALRRAHDDEGRRKAERAAAAERARLAAEEAVQSAEREARENADQDPDAGSEDRAGDASAATVDDGQGTLFDEPQSIQEKNVALSPEATPGPHDQPTVRVPLLTAREMGWSEERRELEDYDLFNRSAMTRKRGLYWAGFLDGVASSGAVEKDELDASMHEAYEIDDFFDLPDSAVAPDLMARLARRPNDLIPVLEDIAGQVRGGISMEGDHEEKDVVNDFLGFCAGIVCDGIVTSKEARAIHTRFHECAVLAKSPLFTRLRWAVDGALADDVFDAEEAEEVREWIAALVTDGHADTGVANIGGVLAPTDPITDADSLYLTGKNVVLTGKMSIGPRRLIGEALEAKGAVLKPRVSSHTDYVAVSNTASKHWKTTHYGTKIEGAMKMIEMGHPMRFVAEHALSDALFGDQIG